MERAERTLESPACSPDRVGALCVEATLPRFPNPVALPSNIYVHVALAAIRWRWACDCTPNAEVGDTFAPELGYWPTTTSASAGPPNSAGWLPWSPACRGAAGHRRRCGVCARLLSTRVRRPHRSSSLGFVGRGTLMQRHIDPTGRWRCAARGRWVGGCGMSAPQQLPPSPALRLRMPTRLHRYDLPRPPHPFNSPQPFIPPHTPSLSPRLYSALPRRCSFLSSSPPLIVPSLFTLSSHPIPIGLPPTPRQPFPDHGIGRQDRFTPSWSPDDSTTARTCRRSCQPRHPQDDLRPLHRGESYVLSLSNLKTISWPWRSHRGPAHLLPLMYQDNSGVQYFTTDEKDNSSHLGLGRRHRVYFFQLRPPGQGGCGDGMAAPPVPHPRATLEFVIIEPIQACTAALHSQLPQMWRVNHRHSAAWPAHIAARGSGGSRARCQS